jgi:hypothetical protein
MDPVSVNAYFPAQLKIGKYHYLLKPNTLLVSQLKEAFELAYTTNPYNPHHVVHHHFHQYHPYSYQPYVHPMMFHPYSGWHGGWHGGREELQGLNGSQR